MTVGSQLNCGNCATAHKVLVSCQNTPGHAGNSICKLQKIKYFLRELQYPRQISNPRA